MTGVNVTINGFCFLGRRKVTLTDDGTQDLAGRKVWVTIGATVWRSFERDDEALRRATVLVVGRRVVVQHCCPMAPSLRSARRK